jgi:hypothetical protein
MTDSPDTARLRGDRSALLAWSITLAVLSPPVGVIWFLGTAMFGAFAGDGFDSTWPGATIAFSIPAIATIGVVFSVRLAHHARSSRYPTLPRTKVRVVALLLSWTALAFTAACWFALFTLFET